MSLSLSQHERDNGVTVIEAEGRLVGPDFGPGSENPLDRLIGDGCWDRKLVFDLSRASFIDSSALGWLLLCKKRMDQGSGRLALHSAREPIREVFRMMRMCSAIPLVDTESEALRLMDSDREGVDES